MTSEPEIAPEVTKLLAWKWAIQDFFESYIDCLDEQRFEQWPAFFTEDGVYKIVARENVERDLPLATWSCLSRAMMQDRVVAIRNASVFSPRYMRHVAGGVRVLEERDGVLPAGLSFSVFETMQDEQTKVFIVGKYRAKIVFTEEGARFQELLVIYDSSLIPGLLVFPI
ncbi:MAG TPA: aromatic-ring-hydroxylating dioxygenase subunit beta [Bryobacteraceae bacterium]|nr:aromatic-ring-hydroxylating dioxygenase subunit beta [Bryobacteraceae bacterium]